MIIPLRVWTAVFSHSQPKEGFSHLKTVAEMVDKVITVTLAVGVWLGHIGQGHPYFICLFVQYFPLPLAICFRAREAPDNCRVDRPGALVIAPVRAPVPYPSDHAGSGERPGRLESLQRPSMSPSVNSLPEPPRR